MDEIKEKEKNKPVKTLSAVFLFIKKAVYLTYWIIITIVAAFICAALIVGMIRNAHAETMVLGVYGKTYKFREKDLLSVIKNKAKKVDWKAVIKHAHIKRKVENYQPYNQEVSLPAALHTKVFEPSMYYTLKFNIKNAMGQIIYPKGFRYKITDYIKLPNVLVVINGDSKRQVEWFEHSKYYNNIYAMPMITKGDYFKLDKKFKIPVYYYMKALQKRFKLKATPSVIWQKGSTIYVKQYGKNAVYQAIKNIKKHKKINKALQESGLINPNYK
jgi:conjugal transfer pilus assembly protein TraW